MDIEWQEGAVCFADGECHYPARKYFVEDSQGFETSFLNIMNYSDFQLSTIKQGDYIEALELNEQKYNDVIEVFGLFGYERSVNYNTLGLFDFCFIAKNGSIGGCSERHLLSVSHRKITFNQLMAIGELKRLEIKRDNKPQLGKNEDGSMKLVKSNFSEKPNSSDAVNKPSHYQFFEGVEVIEIIASSMTNEQFKGYCLGNRIKYRLRAGNKDKLEQEIAKSDKYVELYDEHKHLCKN